MRRSTFTAWTFPVLALFLLIGQIYSTEYALISNAAGSIGGSTTAAYWSNCVIMSRQQAIRPQIPEPKALDSCYLSLLAKFGMKFLSDISTDPLDFFTSLQQMKQKNQQPSVVQLFIKKGTKGYSSLREKQEMISVDSSYVDQGKVNPTLVTGYNAVFDKPLFDQFIKQQLPTLSSSSLDQWFTSVILAIPAVMKQTCDARQPSYNPPPNVDATVDADHEGNVAYHDGHVVDGIANLYLVFWIDDSFQSASPKYVSLATQFAKDIGQSPLYANLIQYTDALGRCPLGARLVDTFVDHRPFPSDLVTKRKDPNLASDQNLKQAMDKLTDQAWRKELADVAAQQKWNTQDYHNFFILLPTMSWGCGYHSHLTINGVPDVGPPGSPWAFISYPYYDGQEQCRAVPQSPNDDHIADIATGIISHELSEGVADPQPGTKAGWDEIADKCHLPSSTIDSQTNGNVTWNGHHYAIQEEYDNLRHGCVLEGP